MARGFILRRWIVSGFWWAFILAGLLVLNPVSSRADGEELDTDQARRECFQGKTIYCLALGLAEERAGHAERALELYRTACRKHPTPGHLRACSPLLTLSKILGRLEEEAAPLEERCSKGHTRTCYYLGREYLNIGEIGLAAHHLEPLCRTGFRSPSEDDYGPCYHLAKGYEDAGQWDRAREGYQFDCEHNPADPAPGCLALKELEKMENVHRQLGQQGIRPFDKSEVVLLLLVVMSVVNAVIGYRGGRWGLIWSIYIAPVLIWGGALTWIYWPEKPEFPSNHWVVICFVLFLVTGMALLALRRQHLKPPHDPA